MSSNSYSFDFPVKTITDLSDIPEHHVTLLQASLLSNRINELSRQPNGAQIAFVYNVDGEQKAKLFDRIKHVESYLKATQDNYSNDPRTIEIVYVLESD